MLLMLCLVISFIPSVLLYIYLRNLRKGDAGYRANCRSMLRGGILCSFGVAALALIFNIVWGLSGFGKSNPLLKAAISAFIIAAFIEEFVKYRTSRKLIRKEADRVSWLDCIAYAAIVGIGFQWIETIVYLIESNPIQILVRGFTMGHPSYGMLMGYFVGKALYTGKKSYKAAAFCVPFLMHGIYDFSLADEFQALNDNLVFVPFIAVTAELVILIRLLFLIRKERKGTKYTMPLRKDAGGDPLADIEIRPSGQADLENIRDLWADGEVMKYVGFPGGLKKSDDEMKEWLAWIDSGRPATDHFSIYSGGTYCGESFYSIDKETGLAALDIKLLPSARGKGIAAKALQYAIDQAFANGAKKCYVDPNPENERAVALYHKLGMIQKEMPEELYDADYPDNLYFEIERQA